MEAAVRRRLPGIRVQVVPPTLPEVLPRMDIAGFVGFAARGPVDVPVPIEDIDRFRDVFGRDQPLAWDASSGRVQTAHLASAVEAFFRNGGRRCWVVRVARNPATNGFPLDGLLDADSGRPAVARARCPGSWSDDHRIGTLLTERLFGTAALPGDDTPRLIYDAGQATYQFALNTTKGQVRPGDLLRLRYDTGEEVYLSVLARRSSSPLIVFGGEGRWFRRTQPAGSPSEDLLSVPATAVLVPPGAEGSAEMLSPCTLRMSRERGVERYDVFFESAPITMPTAGQMLHVTVPGNPAEQRELWLRVDEVNFDDLDADESLPSEEGSPPGAASPPNVVVRVSGGAGLWPLRHSAAEREVLVEQLEETSFTAERLTMGMRVWRRQELESRIDDLGLSGVPVVTAGSFSHTGAQGLEESESGPRFWTRLPDDQALFGFHIDQQPSPPPNGSLEREVYEPRFPLAGPTASGSVFIPLGMAVRPDPGAALGRLDVTPTAGDEGGSSSSALLDAAADGTTALERDGLAQFDAALFLDDDLLDLRLTTLRAHTNEKLYARRQLLTGLHSLSTIDEVTLLAVPDAAHRGWQRTPSEAIPMLAAPAWTDGNPEWREEPSTCLPGTYRLTWTSPSPPDADVVYVLEESPEPDFSKATIRHRGPDSFTTLLFDRTCTRRLYYRVRAEADNLRSPWSSTLGVFVPEPDFTGEAPLGAPSLGIDPSNGWIQWTPVTGASRYVLQSAADPGFFTAVDVKRRDPAEVAHALDPLPREVTYFRVRAERIAAGSDEGIPGPWSETDVFIPPPRYGWTVRTEEAFDAPASGSRVELIALHRALIRFSASRHDVVTLLSLPEHYREDRALAHVAALTPDLSDDRQFDLTAGSTFHRIPALGMDEGGALSYAALYHPWIATRKQGLRHSHVRFAPPDGDVAGMIAARTVARGAWIAPANVPLAEVLSLRPDIEPAGRRMLFDAQVNVLQSEPRGVFPLSADTLSASDELRPISVRRLLILLRRMALREGNTLVFESNSLDLRRRVRFTFVNMLTNLFHRGAFAGETPNAAFRVDTGPSVNPPGSVDRGRLIVELRVAPSRPLTFITVRLVQRDHSGFSVEGV